VPTVDEYIKLRRAVGWQDRIIQSIKAGLENSLFSICALNGKEIVGCGRVVGDWGLYIYIQDVIVVPAFQNMGIGSRIMETIIEFIRRDICNTTYVRLMTSKGTVGFYERFGFVCREADQSSMCFVRSQGKLDS
jgi:GNAT superfamily N-acetyltransferase